MASGPITSWEIDGETVETVSDFILGGSKITEDGYWPHVQKHQFFSTQLSSQSNSHIHTGPLEKP